MNTVELNTNAYEQRHIMDSSVLLKVKCVQLGDKKLRVRNVRPEKRRIRYIQYETVVKLDSLNYMMFNKQTNELELHIWSLPKLRELAKFRVLYAKGPRGGHIYACFALKVAKKCSLCGVVWVNKHACNITRQSYFSYLGRRSSNMWTQLCDGQSYTIREQWPFKEVKFVFFDIETNERMKPRLLCYELTTENFKSERKYGYMEYQDKRPIVHKFLDDLICVASAPWPVLVLVLSYNGSAFDNIYIVKEVLKERRYAKYHSEMLIKCGRLFKLSMFIGRSQIEFRDLFNYVPSFAGGKSLKNVMEEIGGEVKKQTFNVEFAFVALNCAWSKHRSCSAQRHNFRYHMGPNGTRVITGLRIPWETREDIDWQYFTKFKNWHEVCSDIVLRTRDYCRVDVDCVREITRWFFRVLTSVEGKISPHFAVEPFRILYHHYTLPSWCIRNFNEMCLSQTCNTAETAQWLIRGPEEKFLRRAIWGGHVGSSCYGQIVKGSFKMVDFTSMYPSALNAPMPAGKPERIGVNTTAFLDYISHPFHEFVEFVASLREHIDKIPYIEFLNGCLERFYLLKPFVARARLRKDFVECDGSFSVHTPFTCVPAEVKATIPSKRGLHWPEAGDVTGVYCSMDLFVAVLEGWSVTFVETICRPPKEVDIFGFPVDEEKATLANVPMYVIAWQNWDMSVSQYFRDWFELKRTTADTNAKLLAKIILNSTYGKFIQRTDWPSYNVMDNFNGDEESTDIQYLNMGAKTLRKDSRQKDNNTSLLHLGIYCLANSRLLMHALAYGSFKLTGTRVLYGDTDSLVFDADGTVDFRPEVLTGHIGGIDRFDGPNGAYYNLHYSLDYVNCKCGHGEWKEVSVLAKKFYALTCKKCGGRKVAAKGHPRNTTYEMLRQAVYIYQYGQQQLGLAKTEMRTKRFSMKRVLFNVDAQKAFTIEPYELNRNVRVNVPGHVIKCVKCNTWRNRTTQELAYNDCILESDDSDD